MPLDGLLVLDLSQFLSGPYAALRLMDFGARVIKVERPQTGDIARTLYLSDTEIGGDSTLFHAINRGKQSIALDFKSPADLETLYKLIARADVLIQNFRPGVVKRLGLDYETIAALNPRLVYASISGYGADGPWAHLPGQDLLAQSRAGLMWLSGDAEQGPVPMGLAVADMLAGNGVVQGVLAGLVRRGISGRGCHVETSLLEVLIDLQFEVLTTHLNDGGRPPKRAQKDSAHAYLAAPYGVYRTQDGYLSLAMTPLGKLADLMGLPELSDFRDQPRAWFTNRDDIKAVIAKAIAAQTTQYWLDRLEPADIWCAKVLDWPELLADDSFKCLDMLQRVGRDQDISITTTRCPIRINGKRSSSVDAAPRVGQHGKTIREEFGL